MHFCHFPTVFTKAPDVSLDTDWDSIRAWFLAHGHTHPGAKEQADAYGPYQLKVSEDYPAGHQKHTGVDTVHLAVVDIDKASPGQVQAVFNALRDYEWLAHTTWSHHAPPEVHECWRVILPLADPVPAKQWRNAWHDLATRVTLIDAQCKDAKRMYYAPSCPEGRGGEFRENRTGTLLRLDPGKPLPMPARSASSITIGTEALSRAAAALAKRKGTAGEMGHRLQAILDRAPFAAPGERNATAFALVGYVVSEFPEIDPAGFAEVCGPSLDLMAEQDPEGALTCDDIASMVDRTKAAYAQRVEEGNEEQAKERERFLQLSGASASYTLAEREQMTEALGQPLDTMWVIQCNSRYFILSPGLEYTECNREALVQLALQKLAPANLQLQKATPQGMRNLSPAELVELYGRTVKGLIHSLVHTTPAVEQDHLVLPAAPRRDLEPAFDWEVDTWLGLLGGEHSEVLNDWLALVPDLSQPLCALVMSGAPSVGKNLLANGIARIWSTSGNIPELQTFLGSFNSGIEACPLVISDEGIPRDWRGRPMTEDIRRVIQKTSWSVNPKYGVPYTLIGAARFILTGNNDSIYETSGPMTGNDVKAISERFLSIDPDPSAAEYLNSRGGREVIDPQWLKNDKLTRHILYLAAHRGTKYRGRFGVISGADVGRRLVLQNKMRATLLELLVRALQDDHPEVYRGAGGVAVSVETVGNLWESYKRGDRARAPTPYQISRVMKELSPGAVGGLWPVSREHLLDWVNACAWMAPESLDSCLNRSNQSVQAS